MAIESANIVGYGPTDLNGSGLSVGASFVPVTAGDKIDLMDIKVTGYEDEAYGPVQIQTLTEAGGTARTFLWYEYGEGEEYVCGWYEQDEEGNFTQLEAGDVTIYPGEGLWSVSEADTYKLQSAGSVEITADILTPLNGSGLTIANPTPVAVDLVNCYVAGYEDEAYGPVQVQTLTEAGGTARTFLWYEYGEGEEYVCGWYEQDEEGNFTELEANDIVLTPGEGLWSVSESSDFKFAWPKVAL